MERQDQFSTWAQSIYDIRKHNNQWPNIVHFSYGDKGTVPYLQFCDLFVWEVRRRMWQLANNKPIRGDEYPTMWYISERKDFDESIDLGIYHTDKDVREHRDRVKKEVELGVRPLTEIPPGLKLDPSNLKRILLHRDEAKKMENSEAFAAMFAYLHSAGGEAEPIEKEDFTLDCGTPEQGKWYWVSDCPACGEHAPYFEDRSKGRFENPLTGSRPLRVRCVHCGANVFTPPSNLRSVQWRGR